MTVHLLHDGTLATHPGLEMLRGMVKASGAELRVHSVADDGVPALPAMGRYGSVVWLRFLLPDLLPEVARVLYLDADTLVLSPLAPLFATDLGGAPLGAVPNVVMADQRARLLALGLDDYRQFLNSGVLLLDLDRFREEGATSTLLRIAATRADDLLWPDQDTLNLVFAGRWHALHPRWNAQNTFWSEPAVAAEILGTGPLAEARRSPAILHFEGPSLCKPWHALNAHPWRRVWHATLARTPWAGTPTEDRGAATAVLRLMPEDLRIRAYGRLLKWRDRRAVAP
jgi:lipopolysaccharide biosynthesis glycosyltransferase